MCRKIQIQSDTKMSERVKDASNFFVFYLVNKTGNRGERLGLPTHGSLYQGWESTLTNSKAAR